MRDSIDILNDRELDDLVESPSDDCDMASVICVVRELREARTTISAQSARIAELEKRRDELLAAMVRVANETPFADEAKDALAQRGKLVAEVGSLKASVSYWKQEASSAMVRAACAEDATKGYRATLAALGREACELARGTHDAGIDGEAFHARVEQIELAIAAAVGTEGK